MCARPKAWVRYLCLLELNKAYYTPRSELSFVNLGRREKIATIWDWNPFLDFYVSCFYRSSVSSKKHTNVSLGLLGIQLPIKLLNLCICWEKGAPHRIYTASVVIDDLEPESVSHLLGKPEYEFLCKAPHSRGWASLPQKGGTHQCIKPDQNAYSQKKICTANLRKKALLSWMTRTIISLIIAPED